MSSKIFESSYREPYDVLVRRVVEVRHVRLLRRFVRNTGVDGVMLYHGLGGPVLPIDEEGGFSAVRISYVFWRFCPISGKEYFQNRLSGVIGLLVIYRSVGVKIGLVAKDYE